MSETEKDAKERAYMLALMVERIGGSPYAGPTAIRIYQGAQERIEIEERYKPAAENLATLQTWLREKLKGRCRYICDYRDEEHQVTPPWAAYWKEVCGGGYSIIGLNYSDTKIEAESESAMQAAACVLKEIEPHNVDAEAPPKA